MSRPGLGSKLQLCAHPPLTRKPRWLIGSSSSGQMQVKSEPGF
jgi:hypothetical protein